MGSLTTLLIHWPISGGIFTEDETADCLTVLEKRARKEKRKKAANVFGISY